MSKEIFHVKDGLYFEQLPNRKVKITKKQSAWVGAPIIFEQTVEADSWISIVASMTIEGQIASTQKVLELLHLGKPFLNTSEDKP